MHQLILEEIDHTLIETGGVDGEVFKDAFEQVTDHQIDRLADVTGRTEQVIFQEALDLYDIQDPGGSLAGSTLNNQRQNGRYGASYRGDKHCTIIC